MTYTEADIVFTKSALAQLIAHVSQKAREAALEEFLASEAAAKHGRAMCVTGEG